MLNFLTKMLVKITFTLMILCIALAFLVHSSAFQNLDGLGIHIGIRDVLHPDLGIQKIEQNYEQRLQAEIN